MEERRETATELMAKIIMEELQESGERDFIKDWLKENLESTGWKAYMFQKAAEMAAEDSKEKGGESSQADKNEGKQEASEPLKTFELAGRLSQLGHDSIPSSIRSRLLNQLLKEVRRTVEVEQCQSTVAKP